MKISFFKRYDTSKSAEDKRKLLSFAEEQFKALAKKNISIPVQYVQL